MYKGCITDIKGILVGQYSDHENETGCTAILCPEGAVGGVDVRGAAPGTRETDLLRPGNLVERVHGVLLTGGSAYGLAAASGVMRYLSEHGYGFDTGIAKVPIVPAAVLYDLSADKGVVYPSEVEGYQACEAAKAEPIQQGRVGAGSGATVGKVAGPMGAMKGGIGSAAIHLANGVVVAAMITVNAMGDIKDFKGDIIAGARNEERFLDTCALLMGGASNQATAGGNTTIGVVATNARLDKAQTNRLATVAHDGLARVIHPAHTMYDGDTIFSLSLGDHEADFTALCVAATEVTARAILNAVWEANKA